MSDETKFPCGECECRGGCQCEHKAGPAAWEIERDGKRLKVCTRCTLSGDKDRVLLLNEEDSMEPFHTYDILGAFVILGAAQERAEAKTS